MMIYEQHAGGFFFGLVVVIVWDFPPGAPERSVLQQQHPVSFLSCGTSSVK